MRVFFLLLIYVLDILLWVFNMLLLHVDLDELYLTGEKIH